MFPTIGEQGVGCIFLCGVSDASMHFEMGIHQGGDAYLL